MNRRKHLPTIVILSLALVLSIFGGHWSLIRAQSTVPTEPPTGGITVGPVIQSTLTPTPLPPDLTGRFSKVECSVQEPGSGNTETQTDSALQIPLIPDSDDPRMWGGLNLGNDASCQQVTVTVCGVPVRYTPKRSTMYYYRPAIEARKSVVSAVGNAPECRNLNVFFDLNGYERYMYDNQPERFGLYQFNTTTQAWELCPRVRFDATIGRHGRLTCSTSSWTYYALGWPAPPTPTPTTTP